jgi:hypothetical protein
MNTYTPLFSFIVDSSIWAEDDATCKIFVTMLALKDADHIVRFSAFQIGRKANKTEQEVLDAFLVLASPDRKRVEPQEFDGRRIKKVPEGWLVLNGEKYKRMAIQEATKARNRRSQAAFRARAKADGKDEEGIL